MLLNIYIILQYILDFVILLLLLYSFISEKRREEKRREEKRREEKRREEKRREERREEKKREEKREEKRREERSFLADLQLFGLLPECSLINL